MTGGLPRPLRHLSRYSLGALLAFLAVAGLWLASPVEAVLAIRSLSDPARLATLAERGANPRVNKLVYWLDTASRSGIEPGLVIHLAQTLNGVSGPVADLRREALLRNLTIARRLGLLTTDNRERLRRGKAPVVTVGPYAGEPTEVDHIVPVSLAPEIGNELANLELLPQTVNRQKSNRVGERQLALAANLHRAGLLSAEAWKRIEAAARH